jgi:uncharacterized membrane protein
MAEFLRSAEAQVVIWLSVFAVLMAIGGYIVSRVRGQIRGGASDSPRASELMSHFRELHSRGQLSDEEFRSIKTRLSAQLNQESHRPEEKPL